MRQAGVVLLVGVALLMQISGLAWASPGTRGTVDRVFGFEEGQEKPSCDERFVDEKGRVYRLVSAEQPIVDSDSEALTNYYSRQITKDIPLEGLDDLAWYFPKSVQIDDESYQGNIYWTENPYTVLTVYESISGQIDCFFTLEGLPDNDVMRLPWQKDFEVNSDSSVGAVQTKTLDLLDVVYEISATNELGLPIGYSAYLTYRGEESKLVPHHYSVTASYGGLVASTTKHYIVTGHYEQVLEEEPVVAAPVQESVVGVSLTSLDELSLMPLVLTVAASVVVVLTLAWLLPWIFVWRKNACLVRVADDRRRVLVRRKLTMAASETVFRVPDEVNLVDGASYSIELKPSFASRQGVLTIEWRDRILGREELKTDIALRMDTLEAQAAVEALIDKAILVVDATTTCANPTSSALA